MSIAKPPVSSVSAPPSKRRQGGPANVARPASGSRSRNTASRIGVVIDDLSAFTRALRRSLAERNDAGLPSHLTMMNVVARALGHPNVQALKAKQALAPVALSARAQEPNVPALTANAAKAAMQFDTQGRLVRWPSKFTVQRLATWALWMQFDAKRTYREREVNEVLKLWHTFGDHVTLRRELINMKLLSRLSDGSAYWKEPRRPDDEVRALLHVLRARGRD